MVSVKDIVTRLKGEGWALSEEGVESMLEGADLNFQNASQEILNCDLKDVGVPCLPKDMKGNKTLKGPLVLQVSKVRNVSAPKAFEESGGAPRLLRITLTDGTNTVNALEVQNIKVISLKTAPGTKVCLMGNVSVGGGYALLTPNNLTVLGGKVDELFEKWKVSQSVMKYGRNVRAADGSGPPAWVPFGKRIIKDHMDTKHFKAMKEGEEKDKEDDEFENQRKQTVKELAKEGGSKVFGGGRQMLDSNIQRVCQAGFSPEVAEWALRNNKNDPYRAIKELKASISGQPPPVEQKKNQEEEDRRGRGTRGRGRGRGRGKGRGGPDDSDDDMPPPNMPKPSGPASLFDFFDVKMAEKKETIPFVEPVPDVRGPSYQNNRAGRGGRDRGGRGRGRFNAYRASENGRSTPPPDMTSENWPAPGEQKTTVTSNRSYFQSKELMEEREHQEDMAIRSQYHASASDMYQSEYGGQQSGYRDSGRRTGGGGRGGGGNFRGRGGGRGDFNSSGSYRGGRGGNSSGYRGDSGNANNYSGGSSSSYRNDGGSSRYRQNDGGNGGYRGNSSSYSNYGEGQKYSNVYRTESSNYRDSWSDPSYMDRGPNNRQRYEQSHGTKSQVQGNARGGNYGQGMGGGGMQASSARTSKEMELIQDFQRSMTLAGYYQPQETFSYGRYEDGIEYTNFSGTLEFHRGGSGRGNTRRGGRGGYY